MTLTSQILEQLIGLPAFNLESLEHDVTVRDNYPCFIVFCLLFLITVDIQHQVFDSVSTWSNNVNSKQAYPQVTKHFRSVCLWHHTRESIQKCILENTYYYNDNKRLAVLSSKFSSFLAWHAYYCCNNYAFSKMYFWIDS